MKSSTALFLLLSSNFLSFLEAPWALLFNSITYANAPLYAIPHQRRFSPVTPAEAKSHASMPLPCMALQARLLSSLGAGAEN